jgi:hypothetical protein
MLRGPLLLPLLLLAAAGRGADAAAAAAAAAAEAAVRDGEPVVTPAFEAVVADMFSWYCAGRWDAHGVCLQYTRSRAERVFERARDVFSADLHNPAVKETFRSAVRAWKLAEEHFEMRKLAVPRGKWDRQADDMHTRWCARAPAKDAPPGSPNRMLCEGFAAHKAREAAEEL